MHAVLEGKDKKLQWTEVSDPRIKEDEVLLEIHAAALKPSCVLISSMDLSVLFSSSTAVLTSSLCFASTSVQFRMALNA